MSGNIFTYQVIKDTTEHAVIKLTGLFDGSGQESNTARIAANTLYGALNANTVPGLLSDGGTALPYYGLTINRIWYDTASTGSVELFWHQISGGFSCRSPHAYQPLHGPPLYQYRVRALRL